MARVNLKVSPETAARLRATLPELSTDAGEMLTIGGAIDHLLELWGRYLAPDKPRRPSRRAPTRRPPSGQD